MRSAFLSVRGSGKDVTSAADAGATTMKTRVSAIPTPNAWRT
jgi:hypothetical protein